MAVTENKKIIKEDSINISSFNSGLYFVRIKGNNSEVTKRFINE
jgi:hypothetical protein